MRQGTGDCSVVVTALFYIAMSKLIILPFLLVLVVTGCVTSSHGTNLTSGQALTLAKEKLPSPDAGQAYGVQFNGGIWLICLYSASFVAHGPSGIVVAKVTDMDGKVEVLKRLPAGVDIIPATVNDWTKLTPVVRANATNSAVVKSEERL
jgi:hypothetical protein